MTDRSTAAPLSCDEVRDLAPGFVIGALESTEMTAVRAHLAACPEAHDEVDELGGVVPYLADTVEPMTPPAALRERVLAAVSAAAVPAATPGSSAPVVSIAAERARRRSPLASIAAVAAVLVIVGLGAWNVSLRRELDGSETYTAAVDRVLALAGTPGGQAAILAPAEPGGPTGLAAIGANGAVEIAMHGLAPTSGTQVYEAWVIGPDKTPVAIGSFVPGSGGYGTLTTDRAPSSPGVIIALTREPTAGRTSPTPPVLSSGVASGSS